MNQKTQSSAATPCDKTRLHIANLAIELHHARNAARFARDVYYAAARLCESQKELIEETKAEYTAFQGAKRAQYNIQRRLDNACRKVAA